MNDASMGLTDDLTHFMPFYPTTCTEEGEFAALIEIGKIDEWIDVNQRRETKLPERTE